jgi:hypothetical protein
MMGKLKSLVTETMEYADRHGRAKSDALRTLEHKLGYHKGMTMYECRYEERGHDYTLKRWRDGHEEASRGIVTDLPDWLSRIRDVATVGGHLKRVMVPPPDNIVWFTTDDDNNLINFMELK